MSVKCKSCGSELPESVKFCTTCGQPVSPAKSYETNISPIGTELLVAPDAANVYGKTEVLTPEPRNPSSKPTSTSKIAAEAATDPLKYETKATTIPAATDPLKYETKATAIPTAAIKKKSPMKAAGFAAVVLLVVAAASFYLVTKNPSENVIEPVATTSPTALPTPESTQPPVSSATPAQIQGQAAPLPSVSPGKASEPSTPSAEVAAAKSKPTPTPTPDITPPRPTPAPAVAKSEPAPAISAAEHIQRGLKAKSPSAALAEYQSALKADSSNKDVHYLMGLAYQQLGQTDQAFAAYRKCTSGPYAAVAAQHVKKLEKDSKKTKY